ncbi:uncharacterized protein PHACADRAFT_202281 [Phanerochaete carnosa HHB-10118-sp]|uniref:Uncharacterized protein n=1 Tax=Phanerochaete carnosa (strain HHB-10118-sp) TaxID=650164 RepID=K5WFE2_PHACS|nr:uncharacterized protein PHACADRAFT_202281 [Phanerochaete carnosa HHB-10118-sp]EKM48882.1 hypothetical protein PHACADRAFT_202281 [Phanerochaete carnosa HHB-10118-sp]
MFTLTATGAVLKLTGIWTPHTGTPCDVNGNDLPPNTLLAPLPEKASDDYYPFDSRVEFELADFFFRKAEMSASDVDELMQLWAATLPEDEDPPFADNKDVKNAIDAIPLGEVDWQSFSVSYGGPRPSCNIPPWMDDEYRVYFKDPLKVARSQLANPEFVDSIDYTPKRIFDRHNKREYKDFMSGNWAWRQADEIAQDPEAHGATFCPLILGSDKTTVSVATGQNDYYPLYQSIGLIHNSARRAHKGAVALTAFLAIPKTERDFKDDPHFRKFRRQLFHMSLKFILQSVRSVMTTPEVTRCADGHYRRVIYGLGPYIADYPEQALLACIVQGWCPRCAAPSNNLDDGDNVPRSHEHTRALLKTFDLKTLWDDYGIVGDLVPFTVDFPRADIHELLAPDLLHQVIKGTFKDHLVTWTVQYITNEYGSEAPKILADIDRRFNICGSQLPWVEAFPARPGV